MTLGTTLFTEEHRFYFFGRDRDIDDLAEHITKHPLVVLFGASGSGKTSLINVGLCPRLMQGRHQSKAWDFVSLQPGSTPLETLKSKSAKWLEWRDLTVTKKTSRQVLMVIDQFEELFTTSRQEITAFSDAILRLALLPDMHILLALRSDYYSQLMSSPLGKVAQNRLVYIFPLDRAGLHDAITEPAESAGSEIEVALVERLINDTLGEPGALPFLQETLAVLWRRLKQPRLTLSDYENLTQSVEGTRSGLEAAMALHAEEVLKQFPPTSAMLTKRIFMRLVQFGEGRQHTRRTQTEEQLQAESTGGAEVASVIGSLVQERLLTVHADTSDGVRRINLAHEKLIEGWPRLIEWIEELQEGEKQRRRLEEKAIEHGRLGINHALLDDKELQEADNYLKSDAGKVLGQSEQLAILITHSRIALNPGWHSLGTFLLGGAVLCIALWLGVVYLGLFQLEHNVQIAIWLGILLLLVAGFSGIWFSTRRHVYWLQTITQGLGQRKIAHWTVSIGLISSMVGYLLVGLPFMHQIQHCRAAGFQLPTRNVTNVALVNHGIDPYNADVVYRILTNQASIDAWLTTDEEAAQCPLFFNKVANLQPIQDSTGGSSILASIDNAAAVGQPKSVDASCFAVGELAFALVKAIDPQTIIITDDSDALTVDLCKLWSLNYDGQVALAAGNLVEAERLLHQAVQEDPTYAIAHMNLGDVYRMQGDIDSTLEHYKSAITLAPDNGYFHHKLADLYHDLWIAAPDTVHFELAEQAYQAAINANPNLVEAYSGLANLYITGYVKLDQATQLLDSAWAILAVSTTYAPEDKARLQSVLSKNLGLLAYNNENYSAAITYLQQADTFSNAYDLEILNYLGLAYKVSAKADEACTTWSRLELIMSEQQLQLPERLVQELAVCKGQP